MSQKLDRLNAELEVIQKHTNRLSNLQLILGIAGLLAALFVKAIGMFILGTWLIIFIAFLIGWFMHYRKHKEIMAQLDIEFDEFLEEAMVKMSNYIDVSMYGSTPAGELQENSNAAETQVPSSTI